MHVPFITIDGSLDEIAIVVAGIIRDCTLIGIDDLRKLPGRNEYRVRLSVGVSSSPIVFDGDETPGEWLRGAWQAERDENAAFDVFSSLDEQRFERAYDEYLEGDPVYDEEAEHEQWLRLNFGYGAT